MATNHRPFCKVMIVTTLRQGKFTTEYSVVEIATLDLLKSFPTEWEAKNYCVEMNDLVDAETVDIC